MNPAQNSNQIPPDPALDKILSQEDGLTPSSGFALSVMDALADSAKNEAAKNESPRMPWKLVAPAAGMLVLGLLWLLRLIMRPALQPGRIGATAVSGQNSGGRFPGVLPWLHLPANFDLHAFLLGQAPRMTLIAVLIITLILPWLMIALARHIVGGSESSFLD